MVKIVVPGVWASNGQTVFEVAPGPLPHLIKTFVADHPAYGRRLLGRDGEPASYVNICVDEDLVPRLSRPATVVDDHSTVTIIPPMAGG
jgi:molybdopterin synthase sulfur carrier subunit